MPTWEPLPQLDERDTGLTPGGTGAWDGAALRQLVIRDDLTGLFNRRYFRQRLEEEHRRWRRHGRPFALLILDVDDFKEINDAHGHPVGDRVLVQAARLLPGTVRDIDIVCRYAGDEFVVILPEAEEAETRLVAERIAATVANFPWAVRNPPLRGTVTVSVGFAVFPRDATGLAELLEAADRALYRAKDMGKGCFCGVREGPGEASPRGTGPMELPLVGRRAECARLQANLRRALRGEGRLVLVEGGLGAGKSRLAREAEGRARAMGFLSLWGECHEETSDVPFLPLRAPLSSLLQVADLPEAAYNEVPADYRRELLRLLPPLAHWEGEVPGPVPGESPVDKYHLYEGVRAFLAALARRAPLLLVVEDLHWADGATLALLRYLVRNSRGQRLLYCCTFRSDEMIARRAEGPSLARELTSLDREGLVERIRLSNLGREEVGRLLAPLLGADRSGGTLGDLLYAVTEGNPFFLVEMIRFLREEGLLDSADAAELERLGRGRLLPPSVAEIISRRVDRLGEETRQTLAVAAVIGPEFDFDLLMRLTGKNEGHLLGIIDEARSAQLIREVSRKDGDRYTFTHGLLWQVLYERLGSRRRKLLHRQAGEALERASRSRGADLLGELAHHFERGGDPERALRYAVGAADRARDLFANHEAIASYTRALDLLSRLPPTSESAGQALAVLESRGRVWVTLGEHRRALEDFEEMLRRATTVGDRRREGAARNGIATVRMRMGDLSESLRQAEEARAIARRLGDRRVLQAALSVIGSVALQRGKYEAAVRHYRASLAIARQTEDARVQAQNLVNLGVVHWYRGELERASHHYQAAARLLRAGGDKLLLGMCLNNIGILEYRRGQWGEALRHYEESIAICHQTGNRLVHAYGLNNLGEIHQQVGDLSVALEHHEEALRLLQEAGDRPGETEVLRSIGTDRLLLGDAARARPVLEEALEKSRALGRQDYEITILADLTRLHLVTGDLAAAEQALAALEEMAPAAGSREGTATAWVLRGDLHLARGGRPEALAAWRESLRSLGPLAYPQLQWQARWRLGRALEEAGDCPRALAQYWRAVRLVAGIAQSLGESPLREAFWKAGDVPLLLEALTRLEGRQPRRGGRGRGVDPGVLKVG